MQKTIANKLYDTATAKAMGNWQRGYSSERGYISETLYLKKSGEYFLHGEGGPRSRYALRTAPNTWGYGGTIIPFTDEEAHAWAKTASRKTPMTRYLEQTPTIRRSPSC